MVKLLHQIVYATPPPIHTYRNDLPEELENVVAQTMLKDPGQRVSSGASMAAELTRVYKDLRQKYDQLDNQEHFDVLRTLTFFHEFSHAEIWEVLRASDWHEYKDGDDIVREGEIDDRFYIIVEGEVEVRGGQFGRGTTLGTRTTLGFLNMLAGEPTAMEATALDDVITLELELEVMLDLLEDEFQCSRRAAAGHPSAVYDIW